MRGRPKTELLLTKTEQEQLMALTLRRKTAQALALRARIILACARRRQQSRGDASARDAADRVEVVAYTLCPASAGRTA